LSLPIILLITSLFRGSGKSESMVGVNKCDPADHVIQGLLLLLGAILTVVSAIWVKRDFANKE
jgi:hypothetical protein